MERVSMRIFSNKTTTAFKARAVFLAIAIFCVIAIVLGAPVFAHAQTAFQQMGEASTLPTENIAIIVARIIRVFLSIIGILLTVMVIYAGFLFLTAKGDPAPIKKAKEILKNSIIGIFIVFSSYAIATFILDRLLNAAFSGRVGAVTEQYSEPLAGSLGGGILEDHYPERNAEDIPRNTKIFVSFKEAINLVTMIDGYANDHASTKLNVSSVKIYPTETGVNSALRSTDVVVTHDEENKIFVFDPVGYLGSEEENMNYTVLLTTNIERADGSDAFTGMYSNGYSWTFTVSTEVDLTSPFVVRVVPSNNAIEPRNITIEANFSEAMDPVASTGSYISATNNLFTNLGALDASGSHIEGTWEISNGYRTVSFTTTDACGEDPCGSAIFCLPSEQIISAIAKAATLNENEIPQARLFGFTYDGLVDAAGNSLDGNNDGRACGSSLDSVVCSEDRLNDNYKWSFTTTSEIEDTVPQVRALNPGILASSISRTNDIVVSFNTLLKSSTISSTNVSLWPDPFYVMGFALRKDDVDSATDADTLSDSTNVLIEHPMFVSTQEGGRDYWPVLSQGVRSIYQICMYPAIGPTSCVKEGRDTNKPYCCNGVPSQTKCRTDSGAPLPISQSP